MNWYKDKEGASGIFYVQLDAESLMIKFQCFHIPKNMNVSET